MVTVINRSQCTTASLQYIINTSFEIKIKSINKNRTRLVMNHTSAKRTQHTYRVIISSLRVSFSKKWLTGGWKRGTGDDLCVTLPSTQKYLCKPLLPQYLRSLVSLSEGRCTLAGEEADFFIAAEDFGGVDARVTGFLFFRLDSFAPFSFFPLTIILSLLLLFDIATDFRLWLARGFAVGTLESILKFFS